MAKKLFLLTLLLCDPIAAQEFSGKWSGSFQAEGGDHVIPQLIFLKQDGKQLKGTGGPDGSEQYPISNGVVSGDTVRFELTTARAKFFYNLTKAGAQLTGRLEIKSIGRVDRATVSLKKLP